MQVQTKIEIDRYPGIRAFEKNQNNLFKGRESEKAALFDLVHSEELVVLFSKSGVGKSSLLNAGLIPILEQRGYFPVSIRLQPTTAVQKQSLASIIKVNIQSYAGKQTVLSDPSADIETLPLWEYIKSCVFPMNYSPVIIFDQFEEFFSNSSEAQTLLLKEINELLGFEPPVRILEWYKEIPIDERTQAQVEWCEQPVLKVVIGIREDRFGELNSLSGILPNIMRNRFKLEPLSRNGAREAIELPSKMKGNFASPTFEFSEDSLELILEQLSRSKSYIESTQLQIVCNQIENKVKKNIGEKLLALTITPDYFDGKRGIDDMIRNFYNKQINKLPDLVSSRAARELIELELVQNNKRVLLSEDQVITSLIKYLRNNIHRIDDAEKLSDQARQELLTRKANGILKGLLEFRLIRGDYREETKLFEVSHDTLLYPIGKANDLREKEKILQDYNAEIAEAKSKEKIINEEKEKARVERLLKEEAIRLRDIAVSAEKKMQSLLDKVKEERDKANYHKQRAYKLSLALTFIVIFLIVGFVIIYEKRIPG